VLTFLDGFLDSHPWAERWEVVERFSATAHALRASSVNVRVQRTPPVQPAEEDFQQRLGARLLVITVIRARDQFRAEVAIPFPQGNDTPLATPLARVRQSIEAEEQRNR
jgi:hypothetical protein